MFQQEIQKNKQECPVESELSVSIVDRYKYPRAFIFKVILMVTFGFLWPSGIADSVGVRISSFLGTGKSPQSPFAQYMNGRLKPLSDEHLAALTVYLEARGESFAGKLAVAAVIRNRMQAKYQSDGTVKGTVLKRLQFQPWNRAKPEDFQFRISELRMQDSLLAWRMVQDGRNVVQGALLFYNPRLVETPLWATVSHKVASIGGHEFYVPPGKHEV